MTAFDPLRAQREILAGLQDVHKVLLAFAREADGRRAEAEARANALMKLERFVAELESQALSKLRALEAER